MTNKITMRVALEATYDVNGTPAQLMEAYGTTDLRECAAIDRLETVGTILEGADVTRYDIRPLTTTVTPAPGFASSPNETTLDLAFPLTPGHRTGARVSQQTARDLIEELQRGLADIDAAKVRRMEEFGAWLVRLGDPEVRGVASLSDIISRARVAFDLPEEV